MNWVAKPPPDWRNNFSVSGDRLRLNTEQATAVGHSQRLRSFLRLAARRRHRLGKTGYLKNVLARGKQALVMVPEIGLTPQTSPASRTFQCPLKFCALWPERRRASRRLVKAKNGEAAIVIGTRSSLFTPFKNLGVIVMMKSTTVPINSRGWRYHARDRLYRAHSEQILLFWVPPPGTKHCTMFVAQAMAAPDASRGNAPGSQHVLDLKGQQVQAGLAPALITRIRQHLQANQVIYFLTATVCPALLCTTAAG